MELQQGGYRLAVAEALAYEQLTSEHGSAVTSMTRRDPGETGPLVVDIDGDIYLIAADGTITQE